MVDSSYESEKARRQQKTQLQRELEEARRQQTAAERFREGDYRLGAAVENPPEPEEGVEQERAEQLRETQQAQGEEQRALLRAIAKEKAKQEAGAWLRSFLGKRAATAAAGETAAAVTGSGALASALPIIGIVLAVLVAIALLIGLIVTILVYTCNESALGSAASKVASWVGIIPADICAAFSFSGGGTGGAGASGDIPPSPQDSCTDAQKQQLALQNNVPYPARNAPELNTLIQCITSQVVAAGYSTSSLGSIFTYEQSNPSCNYTRGAEGTCGACIHTLNSCHYGGRIRTTGALAVDFGNEAIASQIRTAATICGAGFSLLESDHVHVSTSSCDTDGAGDF